MENMSFVKNHYISYIDRIVKNNKVSHSYLFEIDDYELDSYYIYVFIKMILCNLSYEDVLKSHNSVISLIDQNNYPDITVIEPDGNWIKKSQLISLQKEYSNKSLIGNKRIYIIKNAEKLNPSSANTILKFLEEPEDDIIAMLVTDNRYHIMDTILSRCQVLTLKENNFSFNITDDVLSLLNCIINPNEFFIHYQSFLNNILIDKNVAMDLFQNIENIVISYIHSRHCSDITMDNRITELFDDVHDSRLLYYLKVIEEELFRLKFNVNYKLWLDSFFSRFVVGG